MCDIVLKRAVAAFALLWLGGSLCAAELTEAERAAAAKLREQLEKPVSLEMVDIPMARALDLLARRAGVKFLLVGREDRAVFKESVNLTVDGARAVDLLDALCEQAGLHYEVRADEVRVSSLMDQRDRRVSFYAYAVEDLTRAVEDQPAPSRVLKPLGEPGREPNPFSRLAGSSVTCANLADSIRRHVRPESWDPTLGTSIEERSGKLIVMQTEEVHSLIRRLLAGFRSRVGRQVAVDARTYAVRSADLDRIWRELRGRGVTPPALDAQAFAELERLVQVGGAEARYAGSSVVYNRQIGWLGQLKSRRMLVGYDISGDLYDPDMDTICTGTVIALCPSLSDDASWVSLSVHAGQVEPAGEAAAFQVVRGGMQAVPLGTRKQTVTVRRAKKEGEAKDGETEVVTSSPAPDIPFYPSLQLFLPALIRNRVSEDLLVPAGQWVGVSAPLGGKAGLEYGREFLVLLRCRPLVAAAPPMEPERKDPAEMPEFLRPRLQRKISLTLIETPFLRALDVFSAQSGIPLLLDRARFGDRLNQPVMLELKDVPADEALRLLLRAGGAGVIPYTSLLLVTRRERVNAKRTTLRVFDIRDMCGVREDYPGERCSEEYAGGARAGGGAAGVQFVQPCDLTAMAAPDIAAVLKERLLREDFGDPWTSLEEHGGQLVVTNTPEALSRVERALVEFRQTARRPIGVTARWMVVDRADLAAAFGADPPAAFEPGDLPKVAALLAKPATRDLAAARLLSFNGQEVSSFGGVEQALVEDYDVSGLEYYPVVRSHLGGLLTQVRTLIVEGTGEPGFPTQLRLDVRLALLRPDPSPALVDPTLPPAKEAGGARGPEPLLPGLIQSPETQKVVHACTVRVTNGGAVLLRFPAPSWIAGENAEAARRGDRVGIVVIQAEQTR